MRKILILAAVVVGIGVVAQIALRVPLGAMLGWPVTAYLLIRAWPGIRSDLRRLRAVRVRTPGLKRHDRQGML